MTEWQVEDRTGRAADLLAGWPSVEADPTGRALARCHPTAPALILGSTQPDQVVDAGVARDLDIDVVRRRSGGGAVLVNPDDPVWIDVWIPAGDPLWSRDVAVAFGWLGATWAATLAHVGVTGAEVQGPGAGVTTRLATSICFGGVGAGEVTVDGRKVVGLSQRRSRNGSWFEGACLLHWDPVPLVGLLALDRADRSAASEELNRVVVGLDQLRRPLPGDPLSKALVSEAFVGALPAA